MKDMKKIWNKIFHPFWQFLVFVLVSIIHPIHDALSLIRDEVLPEKLREFFTFRGVFKEVFIMITWYWWIIIGLIIFIVLKAYKDVKKDEQKIENNNLPISDALQSDTLIQEKNAIEQEFERQKERAGNQFKQDLSILAYNMSPNSCKRTYEMHVMPIIKSSIGRPVDMYNLAYFEFYLNHPQFCDLFNNDEVKLVYDRFYGKYPLLKPDGYDKINFANFTRDRSTTIAAPI
jgi:hypothetical protein